MTLRFVDGFDLVNFTDTPASILSKWNVGAFGSGGNNGGSASLSTATTPWGTGQALQESWVNFNTGSGQYLATSLGANYTTLVVGFAFRVDSIPGDTVTWFCFDDSGTAQVSMGCDSSTHAMNVRTGLSGTAFATGSTILINQWYYQEIMVTFATGTGGSIQTRVNGIPDITISGINTAPSGNARANRLRVGCMQPHTSQSNGDFYYDDLYCLDTAGSVNNSFLGQIRVMGLVPTGVGTNTNLTKVGAAATNWQSVNQIPQDGDTTYVASAIPGTLDTYTYAHLPATAASVLAVAGQPIARRDDTGTRSITTHVRSGGSEANAPTSSSVSPQYQVLTQIMEQNPVTSAAWLVSDINAAEFGPDVAA